MSACRGHLQRDHPQRPNGDCRVDRRLIGPARSTLFLEGHGDRGDNLATVARTRRPARCDATGAGPVG